MREALAGLFAAAVVVPLLIVSQFAFASRSWILDGEFYRSITADERLYEGWERGASFAIAEAADERGYRLDAEAMRSALAASFTDAELARLVSSFAADTANRVGSLSVGGDSTLDLATIKRDVGGRLGVFSNAYAASLATGTPASDRDLSVRPAGADTVRLADRISSDLAAALASVPDQVPLRAPPARNARLASLRGRLPLGTVLDRSLFSMIGFTVLAWATCSMLARSRWRARFIWLGSTLGFSSFFPIAAGVVLLIGASPLAGAGGAVVAERLSGMVAEAYRAAGSDAQRIATVLAAALSRVGRSFFVTGLVCAAIAAALSSARFFSPDDGEPVGHGRR